MKITRHIRFIDMPSPFSGSRVEYKFDEPIDPGATLGSQDPDMYKGIDFKADGFNRIWDNDFTIVNDANILRISEIVKAGEVVSVEIRHGYRLDAITLDPAHKLQLLIWHEEDGPGKGLFYWFTVGRDGVFEITARLLPDKDQFIEKLNSDLRDLNMRYYLAKQSLSDAGEALGTDLLAPDIMTHDQAAQYIQLSPKTLYNNREIPRLKHNRYRKSDLDKYLEQKKRKR